MQRSVQFIRQFVSSTSASSASSASHITDDTVLRFGKKLLLKKDSILYMYLNDSYNKEVIIGINKSKELTVSGNFGSNDVEVYNELVEYIQKSEKQSLEQKQDKKEDKQQDKQEDKQQESHQKNKKSNQEQRRIPTYKPFKY